MIMIKNFNYDYDKKFKVFNLIVDKKYYTKFPKVLY